MILILEAGSGHMFQCPCLRDQGIYQGKLKTWMVGLTWYFSDTNPKCVTSLGLANSWDVPSSALNTCSPGDNLPSGQRFDDLD